VVPGIADNMAMLTVTKEFRFEAAHKLPYHDGKCRGLHGHSYQFFLEVRGGLIPPGGPKQSMVIDFKDLGDVGKMIVQKLDHTYLNEVLGFEDTTAEKLCIWIHDFVKERIPQLWSVSVKETESSLARYAPMETSSRW
jgi:6-pyruvoyltetrahydropterin/6-carboxytetrahydropterin synthase